MPDICSEKHLKAARAMRRLLAIYADNEDIINIGAYRKGSSPDIDHAIEMKPLIDQYLQQAVEDGAKLEETIERITQLMLEES